MPRFFQGSFYNFWAFEMSEEVFGAKVVYADFVIVNISNYLDELLHYDLSLWIWKVAIHYTWMRLIFLGKARERIDLNVLATFFSNLQNVRNPRTIRVLSYQAASIGSFDELKRSKEVVSWSHCGQCWFFFIGHDVRCAYFFYKGLPSPLLLILGTRVDFIVIKVLAHVLGFGKTSRLAD